MRTAAICPTCATYENALCVLYNGSYLANIGVSPLDSLEQALISINSNLVTSTGTGDPTASPTHLGQFYVNTTTGVIYYATSLGLGPASWTIIGNGLGFTAENVVNKTTSASDIIAYANSMTKYPSVKSIKDYVDQSVNALDLQAVLNNGHDLVNEINVQGTNAGGGTFSGVNINAFGLNSTANNSGSNVNAMGNGAAFTNTGDHVNAFGDSAGVSNTFDNVTLLGYACVADADDQLCFTNGAGFNARISNINITANRKYELPNASGTIALTSNITTATLQTVTSGTNKNLINGINLQGTNAGGGTFSGTNINALGENAAQNNSGSYVNVLGFSAGEDNIGSNVNGIGVSAAQNNSGGHVNALGQAAAFTNTGSNVNAFGNNAGSGNTISGATIFSNASLPSYANYAAAAAAITVVLGGTAGCTYLYHDQATNSIGAVRL